MIVEGQIVISPEEQAKFEEIYLNYFNDVLLMEGLIDQCSHRAMAKRIIVRTAKALRSIRQKGANTNE